ncbi:hypothetical protein BDE02_05G014900 [Populus trichocarpa]|nr:hypothetical protein BDE02_05G014900 [Populus trichocarpa]
MELDHLGGTYGGNRKPTPFMCLITKIRAGAWCFYLRLTGTDIDVYRYLEPLYNDYRKLRQKLTDGNYSCDIVLPRIKKRWTLETLGALETTKCVLEDDFEKEEEREENEQLDGLDNGADERDYCHERSPARERDRDRRRDSRRYRDHDYDRECGHGRERDRDWDRDRYRLKDERDYGREREREREREGRDCERRDRDRGRQRSLSQSQSRSWDRKRHAHSSSPKRRRDGAEEPKKKREKKEKKDDGTDHPDPEIAEANKLRAALGLKPP